MKRREMLALAAVAVALPLLGANAAEGHVDYTPEAYEAALKSGQPFMLDFYAPW